MERWADKVAIVSGASGGIGAEIAKALVNHGIKVVGLARRIEKLYELQQELGKDKFFPLECDVRKEEDILKAFKWTEEELGGIDILVNNAAAVSSSLMVIDSPTEEYRKVVDTNLIAPTIFARETVQSIRKRNAFGHIININSLTGQFAETISIPFGMYPASKYGLRALGTELRHEIIISKLKIKITNISPGPVQTNMLKELLTNPVNAKLLSPTQGIDNMPILKDKDIADVVIFVLRTPEGVEIPEITIIPQRDVYGIPRSLLSIK